MGLDSADEESSKLNMTFTWRGLFLMMEEVCVSRKFSRNFTSSIKTFCVKRPLAVMSRHRSGSMSIPKQKSHVNMLLGKDESGLVYIKAAPMDSLSYCSKSRIALGKEMIWEIEKNARQNISLSSSQSPFVLHMVCVYNCFAFTMREKGNNFHFSVSCVMPKILRHKHILNSCR
jgi:hypothetical protein